MRTCASFCASRCASNSRSRSGATITAGLAAGVWIDSLVTLAIVWAVLGAGASAVLTPAGRLLRRSAHHGDRPAIFAAQFALSHACWLVTYPLAGWVGGWAGLSVTALLLGGLALMLGIGVRIAAIGGAILMAFMFLAGDVWPANNPINSSHVVEMAAFLGIAYVGAGRFSLQSRFDSKIGWSWVK